MNISSITGQAWCQKAEERVFSSSRGGQAIWHQVRVRPSFTKGKGELGTTDLSLAIPLFPLVLSTFSGLFFTLYYKGGKSWYAPPWRFLSGLRCFIDFRRWNPQDSISIIVTKQTLSLQSQGAQALYLHQEHTPHRLPRSFITFCHLRYSQFVTL